MLKLQISKLTYTIERGIMTVSFLFYLLPVLDNDISDTVLHIMEQSSYLQQIEFSEDMVDGGVEGVCV